MNSLVKFVMLALVCTLAACRTRTVSVVHLDFDEIRPVPTYATISPAGYFDRPPNYGVLLIGQDAELTLKDAPIAFRLELFNQQSSPNGALSERGFAEGLVDISDIRSGQSKSVSLHLRSWAKQEHSGSDVMVVNAIVSIPTPGSAVTNSP